MKPQIHPAAPGEPTFTPRFDAMETPSDLPGALAFALLVAVGLGWTVVMLGIDRFATPADLSSTAAPAAVTAN